MAGKFLYRCLLTILHHLSYTKRIVTHKVITDGGGIRSAINDYLPAPLLDAEWLLVENHGLLKRLLHGEMEPAGVAAHVLQWREATAGLRRTRPPELPPMRGNPARDARAELISHLMSMISAELDAVRAFRRDFLPDGLLLGEQVEPWLMARAKEEGFTAWLEVPIPSDALFEVSPNGREMWTSKPITISEAYPATGVQWRWLEYFPWGGHRPAERIKVGVSGALARLQEASQKVADTGCDPAHATVFILTGGPFPIVPCFRSITYVPEGLSCLNRITLTIDPTLSPREVAKIYADMRSRVFGHRHRAMSEKHTRLALFALMHPDGTLKERMSEWNRAFPRWRYRLETTFGRDIAAAKRRALTTLHHPGTSERDLNEWLMGGAAQPEIPMPKK